MKEASEKGLTGVDNAIEVERASSLAIWKRFEEYKLIVEDISRSSERSQRTNDVFIALNSLFLTALGVLLLSSNLRTWVVAVSFTAVTILALLINSNWLGVIMLHRRVQRVQIGYATAIETFLREDRDFKDTVIGGEGAPFGAFSLLSEKLYGPTITNLRSRFDLRLAIVLTFTYPIATTAVAVLTYLVATGVLAPLSLR